MKVTLLLVLVSLALACAKLAPLLHEGSPTKVVGEYIVVLHPDLGSAQLEQHVEELVADFATSTADNGILYGTFNIGTLKGFSAKLSLDMLVRERAHPDVLYIEVNQVVEAVDSCVTQFSVLWNLDRISETEIDLNGQYHYFESAGAGVDVYIVDTGIQINNVEFEDRASWGFAVDRQNVDGNGHGTHVAGTVGGVQYGVAKKAKLIAVKVLGTDGRGTTAGVIQGVDFVTNAYGQTKRPSVANMSLGGGRSATLVAAVERSIAAGVTYAVAAGNDNSDACNFSPANAPNAITVGATTSQDFRSTFSNWGSCVDISAPGTTITAAWIGSPTAIRTISGTSMASPHVAGAAAIILGRNPNLTPAQVTDTIVDGCTTNVLKDMRTSPNRLLFTTTC